MVQAVGEALQAFFVERPAQAYFVVAQIQPPYGRIVGAQAVQCIQRVQIGFSGGDDAQLGARCGVDDPIQGMQARECLHGAQSVLHSPLDVRRKEFARTVFQFAIEGVVCRHGKRGDWL